MTEPEKRLPYLDRARSEELARKLVMPMRERVRHQLGLDVPRQESKEKPIVSSPDSLQATVTARETQLTKFEMPAVQVEVTTKVAHDLHFSPSVGKDVDDSHIQSPFGRSRGNNDAWKMQQQEEDERAESVVPTKAEQGVAVTSATEAERKRVPVRGETEERQMKAFVDSFPDGETLTLISKNGQKAYYRRDGNDLVGRDNVAKTEAAWKRHQKGWTIEKKGDEDMPVIPSSESDMKEPLQVAHDDNKEEDYASGKVFAEQYLELHPPRAEAEVQLDDIIEKAETIDRKTSEQYEELFLGDMWVAKNSDGSEKRIFITYFLGYGMVDIRKGADASTLREELEEGRSIDTIVAGTISLETLRNTLREDGYVREDHGSRSERDFLETEKIDSVHSPESPEQQKINELRILVGEFRAAYVKEDVEIKGTLGRLRRILGLKKDEEKRQYKEMYEGALKNLRDAEMNMMRSGMAEDGMKSSPQKRKKEAERLLRYYKLDEAINLINERTQYKAENQKISEKIVNSLGDLGRAYNRIPLKQKLLIAGAFAGVTVATALSGGSGTTLGAMAFVSVARKIASGAGTAVGVEALLESFGERGRMTQAEEEIQEQLGTLETESFGAKPEITFDALSAFLEKDIASLDMKLQNEKRAKTWRKLGAVGVGGLVGSGWLTQFAMEKLGIGEAINSMKEHFFGTSSETHLNIPVEEGQTPKGALPSELTDTQKSVDMRAATEYMTASPEEQTLIRDATGLTDAELRALTLQSSAPVLSTESVPVSPQADLETESIPHIQSGIIDTFVDRDIIVEKGDSVWKIAGTLADRLHLEDAQKTHFIDALKDQYGDVRLKAGETINFSEHGVDKEFIEKALGRATSLTADQVASIDANDVKIAAFASSHPDVTLTNESVDNILHGNTADVVLADPSTGMVDDAVMEHETKVGDTLGGGNEGNIKSADIRYERDIVLGKIYNLRSYTDYFNKYPESFAQFRKIDGAYKEFIFSGNSNMQQEIKGKTFASLTNLKGSSLGKFIGLSQKMYGVKLGIPGSKEKVYEYMTRMAMLGIEHPKGAIRLPQSI